MGHGAYDVLTGSKHLNTNCLGSYLLFLGVGSSDQRVDVCPPKFTGIVANMKHESYLSGLKE